MYWLEIQLLHKINQTDNREVEHQKKSLPQLGQASHSKQRHLRSIGVANPVDVSGHGKGLCVRKERFSVRWFKKCHPPQIFRPAA
jgi:hypothetical protein